MKERPKEAKKAKLAPEKLESTHKSTLIPRYEINSSASMGWSALKWIYRSALKVKCAQILSTFNLKYFCNYLCRKTRGRLLVTVGATPAASLLA